MPVTSITEHEGNKYIRTIPLKDSEGNIIANVRVDVYALLNHKFVGCPATAHALKKLWFTGIRGKGNVLDDLKGASAALNRAIQLRDSQINRLNLFRRVVDTMSRLRVEYSHLAEPELVDCVCGTIYKVNVPSMDIIDALGITDNDLRGATLMIMESVARPECSEAKLLLQHACALVDKVIDSTES